MLTIFLKTMWPDLNPLDYSIGPHVGTEACPNNHQNLELLKADGKRCRNCVKQYLQGVCVSFRACVGEAVQVDIKCIEYL